MKIKVYVLDVPLPRWLRPALVGALVVGGVVGSSALVHAEIKNSFKATDPLSAAKLNDNFSGLDSRLAALETATLATRVSKLEAGEKVLRANVAAGGALGEKTGNWLTRSAAQTGATANNTYDIAAGTFATAPTCVLTSADNGANVSIVAYFQS